ncbi:MAG: hypothetical protein HYR50_00375 [Candidatus Rokubacteria bacterium]|nr:hypothetical protein [Candidatus Rokubacteria bacterium]
MKLVALAIVAVAALILAGDWIAGLAVCVLWAGWRFLRTPDGPPVLALAFTFQWVQVTAGIFYYAVTGRRLGAMDLSDYRPMVLIGLGCLVAILLGLKAGLTLARPRGGAPQAVPDLELGWRGLFVTYLVCVALTGTVQELAWRFPAVTQGILALTYARLALIFLMFRRLSQPRIRLGWIGLLLGTEVVLGFTGYFAGFREPLMMAAVALLGAFDRRRLRHWAVLGAVAMLMVSTGLMWMSVRTGHRHDLDSEALASSREERLARIASLSSTWFKSSADELFADIDFFVDRLWAVYYPALAVGRVPAMLPHEQGAILGEALYHIFTPRALFPDKPVLPSDSEMVRKYAGVWVAGTEEGTSIAFGYAAESYVDFGVPLMFVPIFLYALLLGLAYQWLLRAIRHRELGIALVTAVFWLSLYLFERSWIRHLGFTVTLIVYLGGAAILIDRLLLFARRARVRRATQRAPLGRAAR